MEQLELFPEDNKSLLAFHYMDAYLGENYTFSKELDGEMVTWPMLLEAYIRFLSGVYGYDITQKVAIKSEGRPLEAAEWHGPTF